MSGQLIFTVGLPASGKSTWAAKQAKEDPNVRVVTRDDIRTAIHASFDAGDEDVVVRMRDTAVKMYLEKGYTVIVADTNLSAGARKQLIRFVSRIEGDPIPVKYVYFDTPLDVCLARNTKRWERNDRKVPNTSIEDMYLKFFHGGDVLGSLPDYETVTYVP